MVPAEDGAENAGGEHQRDQGDEEAADLAPEAAAPACSAGWWPGFFIGPPRGPLARRLGSRDSRWWRRLRGKRQRRGFGERRRCYIESRKEGFLLRQALG